MKIRTKIIGLVTAVLFLSFLICGAFSVSQFMKASIEGIVQNETEKLAIAERAFRQVGTREDFDEMGELARDAYLKYQFERCYQRGYALLKDDICMKNMTDYDITNPSALKEAYTIQKISGRYILIMKGELEYPQGFSVLSVKDISSAWTSARDQIKMYFLIFLLVFGTAVSVLILLIRRILKALEDLRIQAEAISRGDYSRKVNITSGDELAALSGSLNRMSDRIEQQIEDLELLLGALSHEMKTPVTNIMGYSDSLLHVRLNELQKEKALEAIYRSAGRLNQMSGKLLQLIGLYENQEIAMKDIELGKVLIPVLEEHKTSLSDKKIRISLDNEAVSHFIVRGDEILLGSLLDNIISNSIKALDQGGNIRITCLDRMVIIQDSGCGIPEKDIPHVRKAFYMADKSRSRKQQGAGLGLALADRIVSFHRASMEIKSKEGEGTEVGITFPEV
ncbi:HAMP domain-containing sensor histidine kinase [Clostridium sp. AM58-1XD]|uniref:sensor histidine kinase n=1 Tax=Clostridium sp. AM58-1XD TaxID=2292307 RepID=UPI000E533A7B|nr:HAMP domain-containing sensor histidine kinase [Clostridium sp. AM58-1XD]RGY97013.1 sensor histidine kinase [Clostridium sp. AM58-1XD]